jgi:hypothetical protein
MLVSRVAASARGPRRSLLARPSAALLAVVAVGALAMAGCQANPAPPPLESTSSSPTPSPSPTITAPTLPAEAQGTSKAAAKAFVRHYIALMNHAVATGHVNPLSDASDPGCSSCAAVVQQVDSVYNAGGSIESEGWQIASIRPVPGTPRARPQFDVGLLMSPQNVIEHSGADVTTYDGGKLPASFTLIRQGSEWRVLGWERAA